VDGIGSGIDDQGPGGHWNVCRDGGGAGADRRGAGFFLDGGVAAGDRMVVVDAAVVGDGDRCGGGFAVGDDGSRPVAGFSGEHDMDRHGKADFRETVGWPGIDAWDIPDFDMAGVRAVEHFVAYRGGVWVEASAAAGPAVLFGGADWAAAGNRGGTAEADALPPSTDPAAGGAVGGRDLAGGSQFADHAASGLEMGSDGMGNHPGVWRLPAMDAGRKVSGPSVWRDDVSLGGGADRGGVYDVVYVHLAGPGGVRGHGDRIAMRGGGLHGAGAAGIRAAERVASGGRRDARSGI